MKRFKALIWGANIFRMNMQRPINDVYVLYVIPSFGIWFHSQESFFIEPDRPRLKKEGKI